MIDIESAVFTACKTALKAKFPDVTVESVTNYNPAKLPYVGIEEADNYSYNPTRDTETNENHAVVMYEVNVFSNKSSGKKSEAKKIASAVDEVMNGLGFTRSRMNPINLDGATMYRLFLRYTAIVGKNKTIYRR